MVIKEFCAYTFTDILVTPGSSPNRLMMIGGNGTTLSHVSVIKESYSSDYERIFSLGSRRNSHSYELAARIHGWFDLAHYDIAGGSTPSHGKRSNMSMLFGAGVLLLFLLTVSGGQEVTAPMLSPELEALVAAFKGKPVTKLSVEGLEKSLKSELKSGLYLKGQSKLLRKKPALLYPQHLADDLQRTRLFLAKRGFPNAVVEPRIESTNDGQAVFVVLEIDPGDAVMVQDVVLSGFPEGLSRISVRQLPVASGSRFVDADVEKTVELLRASLREHGYAFAEVEARVAMVGSDGVAIQLIASSGEFYRFGKANIKGTQTNLIPLVRRSVTIREGLPYASSTVRRIEERLRLLALFRQVKVTTIQREGVSGVVDLDIILMDLDPRTLEAGIGYGTENGLVGQVRWLHRNLFRRGRGVRGEALWATYQRLIRGSLWWPGLYGADVRQELQVAAEWDREESYDLNSQEVGTTVAYHPSLRTNYRIGIKTTHVSYDIKTDDPEEFPEEEGFLTLATGRIMYDTSDNRLDPTEGWIAVLTSESTIPNVRSDVRYAWVEGAISSYNPLGRSVVASRVTVGLAWPLGDFEELLPNVRFYAGGSTSMRGFQRRKLGPLDSSENPLGGEMKMEAALEWRVPVWSIAGIAVFVDSGQVWDRKSHGRFDEIEVAVGGGLRFKTPVGPFRFDVGHRLTDIVPSQPKTVYHLALGHAF